MWGYGFPVGGLAAFDPEENGVISPGGVGYDINCGVRLVKTNLRYEEVKDKIEELTVKLFNFVPSVPSPTTIKISFNLLKTLNLFLFNDARISCDIFLLVGVLF